MLNQELLDFIINSRAIGQTDDQIRSTLSDSGWQETDISEGFQSLDSTLPKQNNLGISAEDQSYSRSLTPQQRHDRRLIIASASFLVLFFISIAGAGIYYYKSRVAASTSKKNTASSNKSNSVGKTSSDTKKSNTATPTPPSQNNPKPSSPTPNKQSSAAPKPATPNQPSASWIKATCPVYQGGYGTPFTFSYPNNLFIQNLDRGHPVIDNISGGAYDEVAEIYSSGINSFEEEVNDAVPFATSPKTTTAFATSSGLTGTKITASGSFSGSTIQYDEIILHTGKQSELGSEITITVSGTYGYGAGAGHGIYNGSIDIIDQIAKTISL
ncbi:MAG: hypothetical protein Q7S53_01640 [bacterium]|nr:hypothetical protein [bacterium]